MSDFQDECFRHHLLEYYLSLSFRSVTLCNFNLILSDYKNIDRNLLWYSPPCSSELKDTKDVLLQVVGQNKVVSTMIAVKSINSSSGDYTFIELQELPSKVRISF